MKYAKWLLVLALLGGVSFSGWQFTQATVSSTAPRNDYVGTGSVSAYNYTFRIFANSDLRVTTQTSAGVVTALVLTTDYTVTGANNPNGGTITLVAGNLASGTTLTIRSDRTPQQSTNLRNQGSFSASTHETKFDELTRYAQQLRDVLSRSIHFPETEIGTDASTTLPSATLRASKFLAFDASGNALAAAGTSANLGPVSSYINTLLDDASASAARTTLGAVNIAGDTMTGNLDVTKAAIPTIGINTTHATNSTAHLQFLKSGTTKWALANDLNQNGTNEFSFYDSVADSERLRITNAGVLSLLIGQLKFPSTANPSADANTLDDYEEFDWTPSVGGTATYTQREGKGTKIGRQVHLHCEMVINTIGTGSTSVISGIPVAYTHRTTVPAYGSVGSVYAQTLSQNVVDLKVRIASAGVTAIMESLTAAGVSHSAAAVIGNGTVIVFDITYFTD